MYLIHKYWARKPHNVVSQYIQRYSKPGEIVLDPFGGSGVTAMEAIKAGRKAVSVDLNPMSAFLIENTLSQVDSREIEEEFRRIESKLKGKINDLYETKCPKCGKTATRAGDDLGPRTGTSRWSCVVCAARARNMPPRQSERTSTCFDRIGKLKPKWHPKK